jgi:UDP-N-acetylglucosamine diphosphorylase / glucose-1-phosphate thymidylyltransferase / UDP-N-acetylgalactosamine diphosphorylase / glucosamine-1-phosphate N-acetyltransferase / galactosamine-1-phosphate N-acetyltransferase
LRFSWFYFWRIDIRPAIGQTRHAENALPKDVFMRLILLDRPTPQRRNFYPLALSRPIWELRCGMTSLCEKLFYRVKPKEMACFMPPYLAEVWRTGWPVNDPLSLSDADLALVDARVKADGLPKLDEGPSRLYLGADGEVLAARIVREDLARLQTDSLDALLASARRNLSLASDDKLAAWNYIWELILANPAQLTEDFRAAGRSGIDAEAVLEDPVAIRGSRGDVFIGRGAKIHPMVVLDAENGPIFIDVCAEIHPFTRIEGPCYVGRNSILLGAKCREGNSIGPMCRLGGEVEASIIQGYSNKYHDGFLGHAYVGEWVNLGALTTNSDLKNDYSEVKISLDGRTQLSTGSTKVGALIGDHAKTSIGTLLNTGACVGAMTLLVTSGNLLPKFIPSFTWHLNDAIVPGAGKASLYSTARTAMSRRERRWTEADEAMWNAVYDITAGEREEAIERSKRKTRGT